MRNELKVAQAFQPAVSQDSSPASRGLSSLLVTRKSSIAGLRTLLFYFSLAAWLL
jgi:hypothetical protein